MPVATLVTTLKILLFRAGPQDMPFAPTLTRLLLSLAALSNWLLFALLLSPLQAALMAVASVLGVVLATEMILRPRGLTNRVSQTLSALLATGTVLNLLMLIPASQVAPHLAELAKHPELLKQPAKLNLPQGAVLGVDAINLWAFAVSAHIYRQATNARVLGGIGFAVLASVLVLVLVFFVATLASSLLG